ncbi:MAG: zinc ribbon domain-containing protein [Caldilinea sp.]|nr:zinc ribbon domain-containing protein [Caldilinea sp.]MDW8442555.1 zinc ribbon domain-containing protein [Caldilineaceae bacterium]
MATLLCPHCGAPNRVGANFCNRCGANLRTPDGDVGRVADASATAGAQSPSAAGEQPWLDPGFLGEDDAPFEEEDPDVGGEMTPPRPASRLVSGVQGLLEPLRIAALPEEHGTSFSSPIPAESLLNATQMRQVRQWMAEETLVGVEVQPAVTQAPRLWLPWIFLLMGMGVLFPLLLRPSPLPGEPIRWEGVESGFQAIEALPSGALVQVLWAYDPATAGEMEMLAAPVLRHLQRRQTVLDIISLLPNGPATARRLFASLAEARSSDLSGIPVQPTIDVRFLPGGVVALPSLGSVRSRLAVVLAAQPEDVQHWLEQVAPLNRAPVVAVTAAGADPPLRPYLQSGQLVGLVSGFDGAYHYVRLLDETPSAFEPSRMRLQFAVQQYGALTIVLIVALGNLALLLRGGREHG